MDEIVKVVISGFSGPLEEFYNDSLEIYREGLVVYNGVVDGNEEKYTITSVSSGFQIVFSTLALSLMDLQKNQIIKDKNRGGYRIEYFLPDGEEHSYLFYGLMDENGHSGIKDVLLDLIPTYEELPKYLNDVVIKEEEREVIVN